jgi:hypothetical protein
VLDGIDMPISPQPARPLSSGAASRFLLTTASSLPFGLGERDDALPGALPFSLLVRTRTVDEPYRWNPANLSDPPPSLALAAAADRHRHPLDRPPSRSPSALSAAQLPALLRPHSPLFPHAAHAHVSVAWHHAVDTRPLSRLSDSRPGTANTPVRPRSFDHWFVD